MSLLIAYTIFDLLPIVYHPFPIAYSLGCKPHHKYDSKSSTTSMAVQNEKGEGNAEISFGTGNVAGDTYRQYAIDNEQCIYIYIYMYILIGSPTVFTGPTFFLGPTSFFGLGD